MFAKDEKGKKAESLPNSRLSATYFTSICSVFKGGIV